MAIVVILVLAILWAAVLLPPLLRARNEGGGGGGLGELLASFHSSFDRFRPVDQDLPPMQPLVGPVGPVGTMGPVRPSGGMDSSQRRRRDILIGLLLAVGITLVMAAFSGGTIVFIALQLIADVLLGAYVYLLLQLKSRQDVRRNTPRAARPATGRHLRPVPSFPDTTPLPEPALALRRTATY